MLTRADYSALREGHSDVPTTRKSLVDSLKKFHSTNVQMCHSFSEAYFQFLFEFAISSHGTINLYVCYLKVE